MDTMSREIIEHNLFIFSEVGSFSILNIVAICSLEEWRIQGNGSCNLLLDSKSASVATRLVVSITKLELWPICNPVIRPYLFFSVHVNPISLDLPPHFLTNANIYLSVLELIPAFISRIFCAVRVL